MRALVPFIALLFVAPLALASLQARAPRERPAESARAAQKPDTLAIQAAAQAWLASIDRGEYAKAWTESSTLFRARVDSPTWTQMITQSRAPMGKVLSRKLKGEKRLTTVPGAPDGQYMVLEYATSFEHKASAIETLTPMLDKGGKWRVSGYFIK